jgi:hypothetical protein
MVASLFQFLQFVERDIAAALEVLKGGKRAEALEMAVATLHCLVSIGKGMRERDNVPIDLEAEDSRLAFWEGEGAGRAVQLYILRMIEAVTDAFPNEGDVVELACAILRTGCSESSTGPFVFPPQALTQFLLRFQHDTPGLGFVLATACALISSHSRDSSPKIDAEAASLLAFVVDLTQRLGGR